MTEKSPSIYEKFVRKFRKEKVPSSMGHLQRGGSPSKTIPILDAIKELKRVPLECDTVLTARSLGISFGDEQWQLEQENLKI